MSVPARIMRTIPGTAALAAALCMGILTVGAEERLVLETRVNGRPARLVFDTGATDPIVFSNGVERLALRIANRPRGAGQASNSVPSSFTAITEVELGQKSVRTSFKVSDLPPHLDKAIDGVVGWAILEECVFKLDAAALKVELLGAAPEDTAAWTTLPIIPRSRQLVVELSGSETNLPTVSIDTGSDRGVTLNAHRWSAWKAADSKYVATMYAGFVPGAGLVVREEALARQLSVGPLTLTNVPVMEASEFEAAQAGAGFEAGLGLAALKQLDFIVDGNQGIAYVRPKNISSARYEHNRLGAVFVPRETGDDLVAHVADGSPAHEAGIRNGDLLLKIDDLDVTKWRTDPNVLPLTRFWFRPAGTKLDLSLKRGAESSQKAVVLREILAPEK